MESIPVEDRLLCHESEINSQLLFSLIGTSGKKEVQLWLQNRLDDESSTV